ncbi:MAG: hypothetical protein AAB467_00310 [Patescibacteria group bacterium]
MSNYRFTMISLTVVAVLSSFGCAHQGIARQIDPSAQTSDNDERLAKRDAAYQLRNELKIMMLSDLKMLFEKTNEPKILKVSEFLDANLVTFIDYDKKIVRLDTAPREHTVLFFIFMGDELKNSPHLAGMMPPDGGWGYVMPFGPTPATTIPLMVVSTLRPSRLVNALLMLQAGERAMWLYTLPKDGKKLADLEIAQVEVFIHQHLMKAMDKLGGEKYAELVEEIINVLEGRVPELSRDDSARMVNRQQAVIDEIFEKPGKFERGFIWNELVLEAKFRLIDRILLPDKRSANDAKAQIYLDDIRASEKK